MRRGSDTWVVRLRTTTRLQIQWYVSLSIRPGYRSDFSKMDVGEALLLDCASIRLAMIYGHRSLAHVRSHYVDAGGPV